MNNGLFIFGASGHAKVVIDAVERAAREKVLFICDDAEERRGCTLMGYSIIGGRAALLARAHEVRRAVVGIGDNTARIHVSDWLIERGYSFSTVVHPAASVGRDVQIGDGSVVFAGCVINSGTTVGRHAIVNTAATIDHDCEIGDGVHVAPGAHLCGGVSVGPGTLVGAGSTIIPGVRIGAGVVIGAGSTVLENVPEGARVGGSPCRPLT